MANSVRKKVYLAIKRLIDIIGSLIGIILFVGIPLPTTGTWTAAAIASILRMRLIEALSGIFIGNILSGLIVSLLSYHIL